MFKIASVTWDPPQNLLGNLRRSSTPLRCKGLNSSFVPSALAISPARTKVYPPLLFRGFTSDTFLSNFEVLATSLNTIHNTMTCRIYLEKEVSAIPLPGALINPRHPNETRTPVPNMCSDIKIFLKTYSESECRYFCSFHHFILIKK